MSADFWIFIPSCDHPAIFVFDLWRYRVLRPLTHSSSPYGPLSGPLSSIVTASTGNAGSQSAAKTTTTPPLSTSTNNQPISHIPAGTEANPSAFYTQQNKKKPKCETRIFTDPLWKYKEMMKES